MTSFTRLFNLICDAIHQLIRENAFGQEQTLHGRNSLLLFAFHEFQKST